MRRLKQALRRLTEPLRRKLNARIESLAFQASMRAIHESRGLTHDLALQAMNQALAAYKSPSPWAEEWVNEVTQVLDSVVAEQFRLQSQIEDLEGLLREALAGRALTADD